jgi:hypothetical protein
MHITHTLPNPLARLTRVIVAFEEARRAGRTPHQGDVATERVDHDADLDGLSLCPRSSDAGRTPVPLDWMSMMSATPTKEPCAPDELSCNSLSLRDRRDV